MGSATEPCCQGVEKLQDFQNRENDPFLLVFRLFVAFPWICYTHGQLHGS